MDTDNYVAFKYNSSVPGIPQGLVCSSRDRKLLHPYYNFTNVDLSVPSAPSVLKTQEVSESSISVAWKDNSSNEEGFVISRSLASEPATTVEISVNANDTCLYRQGSQARHSLCLLCKSCQYCRIFRIQQ